MIRALYAAASGMASQQTQIDVVANNLANINTPGYKRVRAQFADLLYDQVRAADGQPAGVQVGQGVRPGITLRIFTPGTINLTGNPLDLYIQGDGFFRLRLAGGQVAYTRDGTFRPDGQGRLTDARGHLLLDGDDQPVALPPGVSEIKIAGDGAMTYQDPASGAEQPLGRLALARFSNPAGLLALGDNLLAETAASGAATVDTPGAAGLGRLQQGALEAANVEAVAEMVNLIVAQRAYELNSKALQSADEMMAMANNLRRG